MKDINMHGRRILTLLDKTIEAERRIREYERARDKRMREMALEAVEQWEQDTCPKKEADK